MNKYQKSYRDFHNLKKEHKQAIREYLKEQGRKGGIKSVLKRFQGKTKEEISEIMRQVRAGKKRAK